MATRGIHLIWTTYMTWLPGDARGHWSPLFDFYGHVVRSGGSLNKPSARTRARARSLAKETPKSLTEYETQVVAGVIDRLVDRAHHIAPGMSARHIAPGMPGAILKPITGLHIRAAAIEATHVHLLIDPIPIDIGVVAGRLKSMTSSALVALPQNRQRRRTWTTGYWKVFLFDDAAVDAVRGYIEQHNVRRGLAPAPFPWIDGSK